MNIIEMVKEGLRIARTSKSLWLYGFFVGLSLKGSNQGHAPGAPHAVTGVAHAFTGATALLGIAILAVIALGVFMYFVSEGALIGGVTRIRGGKPPTVHEGWRDGLAHWGVLFRIATVYLATTVASLIVLAAPALLAQRLSGTALAVTLTIPAALIAARVACHAVHVAGVRRAHRCARKSSRTRCHRQGAAFPARPLVAGT